MSDRASWKSLRLGFDEALAKLPEALKAEGFGILTKIDLQATFREKLGVEQGRYLILGACNPKFAKAAIDTDPRAGVLLPCNVVLREEEGGRAILGIIDPLQQIAGADARFGPLAAEVKARLDRVLAAID